MLQVIKNQLKCILPPPIRTFLREIDGLRNFLLEQNANVLKQLAEENACLRDQFAELNMGILELLAEQNKDLRAMLAEQNTSFQGTIAGQNSEIRKLKEQLVEQVTGFQAQLRALEAKIEELEAQDRERHVHQQKEQQRLNVLLEGQQETLSAQKVLVLQEAEANAARFAALKSAWDAGTEQWNQDKQDICKRLDEINTFQRKAAEPKPAPSDYAYHKALPITEYKAELKRWYERRTGTPLNLENPVTFNEKIQWMKLYDSTPLKTQLTDKYRVREWVRDKIGEEYLVPLLGVWDRFEEIDFDALPERFVLKANHGCGWNLIVTDKSQFDMRAAQEKFQNWLRTNYAYFGLELQYLNIPPKIIAEEYLENENADLYDYKVLCFHGKAESIMFLSERKDDLKMAFYNLEWKKLPFVYTFPMKQEEVPKPRNLELLIRLAERLAEGFPLVRVDFYILNNGQIKFGEMTFTPSNGLAKWDPPHQDSVYGRRIQLPPKSPLLVLLDS